MFYLLWHFYPCFCPSVNSSCILMHGKVYCKSQYTLRHHVCHLLEFNVSDPPPIFKKKIKYYRYRYSPSQIPAVSLLSQSSLLCISSIFVYIPKLNKLLKTYINGISNFLCNLFLLNIWVKIWFEIYPVPVFTFSGTRFWHLASVKM